MTEQQTLTELLAARLDEDEAAARATLIGVDGSGDWRADERPVALTVDLYRVRDVNARPVVEAVKSLYGDEGPAEPLYVDSQAIASHIARVLREAAAKRAIIDHEIPLTEWKLDNCGCDSWMLDGLGFFAECWPDNTVNAWICEGTDGPLLDSSGVKAKADLAACQAFAESWIREHLAERSPVLRHLAAVCSDHPDYREEWRA